MMERASSWLVHAGRVGLASLFILGGVNKIASFGPTAARMEEFGLSPAGLLLPATIGLELIGGLMVASGVRFHQIAALALAAFTIATNLVFHRFWEMDGQIGQLELSLFFKNVAIAGALLLVAGGGAAARPSALSDGR
jgi:putative oxidoreductase